MRVGVGTAVKRSAQRFVADDMSTYAAALAYQVFFSLFPFVIFLLALLGFLRIPGFFDFLLNQARTVLPGQAAGLAEGVIEQIRNQSGGGLLSLGAVVALYSASGAVRAAMHAFNIAYEAEDRPAWKQYPLSLVYTVILAALLIAAAGLMVLGPQIATWFADQVGLGALFVALWTWLRIPVAVLLLVVVLALVYYLFPNTRQPFRLVTPGALLAAIVWLAASLGFAYYAANFANYSATYGSLGAIVLLLLYFFISSAVLLFGAEVNAEVYRETVEDEGGAGEEQADAG